MKGFTENLTYDGSAAVKARLEFRQLAEPYELNFAKNINVIISKMRVKLLLKHCNSLD